MRLCCCRRLQAFVNVAQCIAAMAQHSLENYDLAEARKHAAKAYAEIQAKIQAKKDGTAEEADDDSDSDKD